jgi:hypothetical protein
MGRRRRDGNQTPEKFNSIQDLERNEKMDTHFLTQTKQ